MNGNTEKWRKYIDLEHSTCYSPDNYWCALTDGKMKYIWRFHTGEEELFDLSMDPHELKNVAKEKRYRSQLLLACSHGASSVGEGRGVCKRWTTSSLETYSSLQSAFP